MKRLIAVCAVLLACSVMAGERMPLAPHAPAVIAESTFGIWSFIDVKDAWPVMNQANVSVSDGVMKIEATGSDSQLRVPVTGVNGPLVLRWRMKTAVQGPVDIYWATSDDPAMSAKKSIRCRTINDGRWREYSATLMITGVVQVIRFDPCTQPGTVELCDAKVTQLVLHPLQFVKLDAAPGVARGTIHNSATNEIDFAVGGKGFSVKAGQDVDFELPLKTGRPFEQVQVEIVPANLPLLVRTLYIHNPKAETEWSVLEKGSTKVCVAKDGSGLRLFHKGGLVGFAAPLAECKGARIPLTCSVVGRDIVLSGGLVERLAIGIEEGDVAVDLKSSERITGPAIRAVGGLEQGLLAGVEYLGKGERSSTMLDIETPEHVRFEPDPMWMTMQLAGFVTDCGAVAMVWDDSSLQPVYSVPNLYDNSADNMMAVKGVRIKLRVRLGDGFSSGGRLEDSILWAVKLRGLPELPPIPRSAENQRELYIEVLSKTLRSSEGWQHATWDNVKHQPLSAPASCVWRLSGEVPSLTNLVPGGCHVENWAAYLITGRASKWLDVIKGKAEEAIKAQKADGSFRYEGPYARGHFEDTASGWCAGNAIALLDHARFTGDQRSLDAGLRALEYMKHFRTPRGAQPWEIPLHSPDLLGSAWSVKAYVLGYELTKKQEYIDLARRWAITGLPFIYQWGMYPIQKYASIAVLGATDWSGVVWIGLPVQWCGVCYAHSLMDLMKYDQLLDWRTIAEGILRTAESMQYTEGQHKGCLPDSFNIAEQRRLPAGVNPCVSIAVRLRLEGQLDSLAVATDGVHRIVAPFPVTMKDGRAVINGQAGVTYEVVVDGKYIHAISSKGVDEIAL